MTRTYAGLDVSDRISVVMSVPQEHDGWARAHSELIAREILATSFEFGEPAAATEIGDGVRVAVIDSGVEQRTEIIGEVRWSLEMDVGGKHEPRHGERPSRSPEALLDLLPMPTYTDRLASNYFANPVKTLDEIRIETVPVPHGTEFRFHLRARHQGVEGLAHRNARGRARLRHVGPLRPVLLDVVEFVARQQEWRPTAGAKLLSERPCQRFRRRAGRHDHRTIVERI